MERKTRTRGLTLVYAMGFLLCCGGSGKAAEETPPSDPARIVTENGELEKEVSLREQRTNETANINKALAREAANEEKVVALQREMIAAIPGEAKPADASPATGLTPAASTAPVRPATESMTEDKGLVFAHPFDATFKIPESRSAFASIQILDDGREALVIDFPEPKEKLLPLISLPLPIDELAGEKLRFLVSIRAENISKPAAHFHGGKFNLVVRDQNDKTQWPGLSLGGGSFDWKRVSFVADIPYGAKTVIANFGLQEATGKIMFRDFRVELAE